ncbi:MAG: ROK family protein [Candidatus Saccharimonadales bacterium]
MLVTVDTGGTKTLVASFSSDGLIQKKVKFQTPPDQTDYVTLLTATLSEQFGNETIDAISIALPGTVVNNVVTWCNNLTWENFDITASLAPYFKGIPIFVDNDANLAGLAETRILDPIPTSSLYVTVSTGIGTGVTTNGQIDPGLRHSEGGRILIEFEGKVREWESFASGKAIYGIFGKFARDITDENDWLQISDRISRGFLAVIPMVQPDVVIIGGSIGTYFERFGTSLEAILRDRLPSHIPCPQFLQAAHPEEAVIYGCYYYAIDCLAVK